MGGELCQTSTRTVCMSRGAGAGLIQTLSRLCSSEWVALSKLGKIQPDITLLVNTLKTDHPAEVHKFFDS